MGKPATVVRSSRFLRVMLVAFALCAACICLALAPRTARAAGSVTYEQRNYDVRIQHDGSVVVTEHWQVHFNGGPFHHAFLAVYLAKTSGIAFGQVRGDGVANQQTTETTDTDGNPMEQVAWDYPATSDATRTFDIPYTIQGALGIGTTQAWLDWHFLDGGSPNSFPVTAAEVRITLPAATSVQNLTVNSYDTAGPLKAGPVDARTVVVAGQQLTSNIPLEVEVAFPRSQIDAALARPAWQDSDAPPTLPTALGTSQPSNNPGSYNPGSYDSGPPGSSSFSPMDTIGPMLLVCSLPLLLAILSALGLGRRGGGWGVRNRYWNNTGGPWYRGPWSNGGGPWIGGGGGGFGGGGGGGSGGGGGGGSSGFS